MQSQNTALKAKVREFENQPTTLWFDTQTIGTLESCTQALLIKTQLACNFFGNEIWMLIISNNTVYTRM